jgi:hypothetical protein
MLRSAGTEALHELGLAAAYSAITSDNSKAEPWTAVLLSYDRCILCSFVQQGQQASYGTSVRDGYEDLLKLLSRIVKILALLAAASPGRFG